MDYHENYLIGSVSEQSIPINCSAFSMLSPTEEFYPIEKTDFCGSPEDIQSSLLYLQNVLTSEACPYSILVNETNDDTLSLVQLLNAFNWLLGRLREQYHLIEDKDNISLRARAEANTLEVKLGVVRKEKDKALLMNSKQQELERQLTQRNRALSERYKRSHEEITKMKSQSLHLQTQCSHDTRKREKEIEKLKERLDQLVTDKNRDQKKSLEMLNAIKKSGDVGRARWNQEGKKETEMFQALIRQYEEKQKDLVEENKNLRKALAEMDTQLTQFISSSSFSQSPKSSSLNSSSNDIQLDLPFSYVHHELQGKLRDKCTELNNKLRNLTLKKYDNDTANNQPCLQQQHPIIEKSLNANIMSQQEMLKEDREDENGSYGNNSVELDHSISGDEESILNLATTNFTP